MLRPATPADAPEIATSLRHAFDAYRAFAPPGWVPPDPDAERERLAPALADPRRWCLVAELRGSFAGHVTLVPAALSRAPDPDPRLAHLSELFVRPHAWGSGVASTLLAEAVAEAARRGFERMRLFTPAAHGRARRFYEREGWRQAGAVTEHHLLGLPVVEYRRALEPGRGAAGPPGAGREGDPGPPPAPAR